MDGLLTITPSQTVGPYFAYGITAEQYGYAYTQIASGKLITDINVQGKRIKINGRVIDGGGNPITDAVIEIWQADHAGNYANPNFRGFGRVGTGTAQDNSFEFETIKPGRVANQAPHINVIVLMRGLLTHAFTRIYFDDETAANQQDAFLNAVPAGRRNSLVAQKVLGSYDEVYRFDIYMQGENETVFFEF